MYKDEREFSRLRERRNGYIERPRFEEYSRKYADHFTMKRENGVLEVQLHSDGGPNVLDVKIHNDWVHLWSDIGADPDNEVLILYGTGDTWMEFGPDSMGDDPVRDLPSDSYYDHQYVDSIKAVESLIFQVEIPTIACINGPGIHTEFALLCDVTLCADHAVLFDPHFPAGLVPGDGQYLVFQQLLGLKRSTYHMYTGSQIDARTAKEYGLVNEVLPPADLLPRAREIAAQILEQPRTTRRLTAALARRPWKRLFVQDFGFHVAHEMLALRLDGPV